MMNIEELSKWSDDRIEERIQFLAGGFETRAARAEAEHRAFTSREADLNAQTKDELEALKLEVETRDDNRRIAAEVEKRTAIIDAGIETRHAPKLWRPTLLVSEINLRSHSEALREGRVFGAVEEIEYRSQVANADMGSAGAWNGGTPNEPRNLIRFAGVPVSQLTGKTAQVPKYTGPSGVSGHDEGSANDEYDTIDKVDLTAKRHGRWTNVSSIVGELDDLRSINVMHGWGIARSLDKLACAAIETAASTPESGGSDLEGVVREAILTVAANTYSDEASLVIVGNPEALALLTGTTPTSGTDVESYAVRFSGARLYATNEANDGQVTVFSPSAFRVFQTSLQSASVIDPTDGSHKFGSWLHSTELGLQIVGAAVAVATSGS